MAVLAHLIPLLVVGVVSCLVLQALPVVQGHNVEQVTTEQEQDEARIFMMDPGDSKTRKVQINNTAHYYDT